MSQHYSGAFNLRNISELFKAECVTPKQLTHLTNYAKLGCTLSAANALILTIGVFGKVDTTTLLLWCVITLAKDGFFYARVVRISRKPPPRRVSKRALRRMLLFAGLASAPWAVLPFLFLSSDGGAVNSAIFMMCVGFISGGAFLMHRVPAAAFVYSGLIAFSIIAAALIRDFQALWAVPLGIMPYVWYLVYAMLGFYQVANERERSLDDARVALDQLQQANSELDAMRARAERASVVDELTQLFNRRGLTQEIERRDAESGGGEGVAVFHLDLDRFKQINDTLGHAAGDAVLVHVAKTLTAHTRSTDVVARIGGDEFVIITSYEGDKAPLEMLATRLIKELGKPFQYDGELCSYGVSIGIRAVCAQSNLRSMGIERLLSEADMALYQAKDAGRGRFRFYTSAVSATFALQQTLGATIEAAIENGEFTALYQPQFSAQDYRLVGVEAFARWRHPTRGDLAPDIFLPIAARLGLLGELDRALLGAAASDLRRWDAAGLHAPRLTLNVSLERLRDPALKHSLSDLAAPTSRLTFALQESALADDIDDDLQHMVDWLAESGVEIELDDFGSGRSSMISLLNLMPTRIRVAAALLTPSIPSARNRQLVELLASGANSLGIEVAAQELETKQHVITATEIGCTRLQGFYFARPLSADAFLARFGPGGEGIDAGAALTG